MTKRTPQLDQERLKILSDHACDSLDDVLYSLDVSLQKGNHCYTGNCPIHYQADSNAFCVYTKGYRMPGTWACRTYGCHDLWYDKRKIFAPNIIGLIRGILSAKNGWRKPGDAVYPFNRTISYICDLFNLDLNKIHVDNDEIEKRRFINMVDQSRELNQIKIGKIDLETVKTTLDIPSPYFLERGYKRETLLSFAVGECTNPTKPLFNRAVVPIIDESNKYCLGFTARSIFEKCDKCGEYHQIGTCRRAEKWTNVGDFTGDYLYNYNVAKDHIAKTKVAVLVEGQGDVWRLVQNNVPNAVGMFGLDLTDKKIHLLDKIGTMGLIILTDNDKPGIKARENIMNKYSDLFHIDYVDINQHDIGEMTDGEISKLVIPTIHKLEKRYKL